MTDRVRLLLCLALSTIAAPSFAEVSVSQPLRDVISLCTHDTGDRSQVVSQFIDRGWLKFREPYPEDLPLILADAELIAAFDQPQLASVQVNRHTAAIPDMTEPLSALQASVGRGVFDVLWWSGEARGVLMLSDGIPQGPNKEDLRCRLHVSSMAGATELISAINEHNGRSMMRVSGPVHTVPAFFYGYPPHRPFEGLLGVLVDLGILVDRPLREPQIGAGRSKFWLHYVDVEEFVERFGRQPHASYIVYISRIPEREDQS